MTEQKETTKPTKPLTLSTTTARPSVSAKNADATQVRQKFSHGRTRAVTVEVKKPVKRPAAASAPASAPAAPKPDTPAAPAASTGRTLKLGAGAQTAARAPLSTRPAVGEGRGSGIVLRTLTEEEKEARTRALVDANRDAELARQRAAQEAARRAAEDDARRKAEEEHKKRLAEEETRKKAEEEAKRKADALVQKRLDQAAVAAPQTTVARQTQEIDAGAQPAAPTSAPAARRPAGTPPAQSPGPAVRRPPMRPAVNKRLPAPPGARREAPKRRSDKVDVGRAVEGENDFRSRSVAQQRRRLERERRREHANDVPQQKVYREVTIPEVITVQELASRMSERSADVVKTLMRMGVMATINQAIDPDTAELVVTEMGHRPKRVAEGDVETALAESVDAP